MRDHPATDRFSTNHSQAVLDASGAARCSPVAYGGSAFLACLARDWAYTVRVNRVYQYVWVVVVLAWAGGVVAQPEGPAIDPAIEPARVTGQCLRYQEQVRTLQEQMDQAVRQPAHRLSSVGAALSILSQWRPPDRDDARALDAQAREIQSRIDHHRDLLRGEARPEQEALSREQVQAELVDLKRDLERVQLLAQAYRTQDPWDRQQLQETLALEKRDLEELIEGRREPYREQIEQLKDQATGFSGLLDQAMQPFGLQTNVGELKTEAVRVTSRYEHGLIQFRWLDRRGQLVASAHVNLRAQPDNDRAPPLLADRYPILQHNPQEVLIGVGYFQIQFRADSQDLMGEGKVLEAVQRLLDLEALGQLVPQMGKDGTN